jgi:spermidine/putrescine transport system permease protein
MKGAKVIKKEPFITENKGGGLLKFKRSQLCIPYGLFLSVFVIFPLLLIIYYAFTSKTGTFSLSNFTAFFTEPTNISTLIISIFVSFIVTVICLLISYPVAYILSRLKNSNLAFVLLLLFILPTWLNFVLRAMAMKELLSFIGIPLGSTASIIGLVYDFMPFMIMPLYSTLIKMDKSFEEAASDLGASKLKVFTSVTLPLSKPGIISGVTMVFLPVMSCYVITDTFSGSTGFSLIGKLIAKCFLGENGAPIQINEGAAISLIMLVIMVVTMLLTGGFKNSENARGTNL